MWLENNVYVITFASRKVHFKNRIGNSICVNNGAVINIGF